MFYSLLLFICACGMVYYINKDDAVAAPLETKKVANIEEIAQKNKLVCVKIFKDNCPYCDKISADFGNLKKEFENCLFLDLNRAIREKYVQTIAEKYGISTVPAFIVFVNGAATVFVGSDKLPEVKDLLTKESKKQELESINNEIT